MIKGSIQQINLHQVPLEKELLPQMFPLARDHLHAGASGLHPLC